MGYSLVSCSLLFPVPFLLSSCAQNLYPHGNRAIPSCAHYSHLLSISSDNDRVSSFCIAVSHRFQSILTHIIPFALFLCTQNSPICLPKTRSFSARHPSSALFLGLRVSLFVRLTIRACSLVRQRPGRSRILTRLYCFHNILFYLFGRARSASYLVLAVV